jgi:hypothetical protein
MDRKEVQKEGDAKDDEAEGKNHCAPEVQAVVQVSENTNATGATMNTPEVAEGQAAGSDTQDMDCEPFKASDGQSDDDTAVEHGTGEEERKSNPRSKEGESQQTTKCHQNQEECTPPPHYEALLSINGREFVFLTEFVLIILRYN